MNMIENLTEESGEKELRIMELEKRLKQEEEERMDYFYKNLAYESYVKYLKEPDYQGEYRDIYELVEHFDEDLHHFGDCKIKILEMGMKIAQYSCSILDEEDIEREWEEEFANYDYDEDLEEEEVISYGVNRTWDYEIKDYYTKKTLGCEWDLKDNYEESGAYNPNLEGFTERFTRDKPQRIIDMIEELNEDTPKYMEIRPAKSWNEEAYNGMIFMYYGDN